jgi:hypothetical protein
MESREKGFSDVAVRIFHGAELTPLSEPLPFFAYPLLATTLFWWAWVHYRGAAGTAGVGCAQLSTPRVFGQRATIRLSQRLRREPAQE